MTPEQTGIDGWKNIRVPEEEIFVIGYRGKVYVASPTWAYDRARPEDAEAIAVLDGYLQNKAGDPVDAAAMRVQSMAVMQAVDQN
jgi:hypothetical protein